jgi:hypothetical protein
MNLEDVNVNICFTQLNSRYLNDGKVTIFGKYGRPTRNVDVKTFINIINGYYNVLCGWKVSKVTRLRNCTFILDGMEDFYPSHAWEELSRSHNVRIIYGGDHSNPTLSTADILLKYLDYLLKNTREKLNESTLKKVITYDDKINPENIFYHYIGNPDINSIKPYEDYRYTFNDLRPYIRRPIIFVSKGTLPYQCVITGDVRLFVQLMEFTPTIYLFSSEYPDT